MMTRRAAQSDAELRLLPSHLGVGVYLSDSEDSCGSGIQKWVAETREDVESDATSYATALEASLSSGDSTTSSASSDVSGFFGIQSDAGTVLDDAALFLNSRISTKSSRHDLAERERCQSMIMAHSISFHAKMAALQRRRVRAMAKIEQEHITRLVKAGLQRAGAPSAEKERTATEKMQDMEERVKMAVPETQETSIPIAPPIAAEPRKEAREEMGAAVRGDGEGTQEQGTVTEAGPKPPEMLDSKLFSVEQTPAESPTERVGGVSGVAAEIDVQPSADNEAPNVSQDMGDVLPPTLQEPPPQPLPVQGVQPSTSPIAAMTGPPTPEHPPLQPQPHHEAPQTVPAEVYSPAQAIQMPPVPYPDTSAHVSKPSEQMQDTEMPDQVTPSRELLRMSEHMNVPHDLPPPATLFSVSGIPVMDSANAHQVALHAASTAMRFEAYHREIAQQLITEMGSYQTNIDNRSVCKAIDKNMKLDVAQISAQESQIHVKVSNILRTISQVEGSPGMIYAYVQLARRLVSKCAGISDSLVFAVAKTTVRVMEHHPQLLSILLCFLHEVSVLTVPKYYSSESTHKMLLDSLGFKDIQGGIGKESEDEFITRQSGYVKFYAAIVELNSPVHGLEFGWSYISRILNSLPPSRITASALMSFLSIAGYSMFSKYKKQFYKVLLYIYTRFLVGLADSHDQEAQAVYSRLQTYLQTHQFTRPHQSKQMPQSAISRRVVS